MVETIEILTDEIIDICRENGHTDAQIIVADRIVKHVKPFVVALLRAKSTIRQWNGMGLSGEAEQSCWDAYQSSPEMKEINSALELAYSSDYRKAVL